MKKQLVWLAFGIIVSSAPAGGRSETIVCYPKALNRAAVATASLDEPIQDALILGNGDLNGLLFAEGDDLVLMITKNDVWDARLDTKLDPPLPTLARLKELGAGSWERRNRILPEASTWEGRDSYQAHDHPCPRVCARARIEGAGRTPLVGRLDIMRGRAELHADGTSSRVFVAADSNVIVITTHPNAKVGLDTEFPFQARPNSQQRGRTGGTHWVAQEIPGDADWPGMRFALAWASKASPAATTQVRSVIALVTSMEADDPLQSAIELAGRTLQRDATELDGVHLDAWLSFWSASGIEIGDHLLEQVWYRSLYFLRCVVKPGVVSPGLFAGLLHDSPAWHGDYHTNYNIQQTYWSAYAANHCELNEPYDRLIADYLPRARWLARRMFDCEGAYFPHVLFAYEPSDPERCKSPNGRQYIHHVWGWTLGVSGFTVQPLWWRYKYEPNADYLRNVAYPAVRDVADFYAAFIERCERSGNRVVLAPTVSPEHWGWTENFERNRNCAFDIAMFHFVFEAAVEAATRLGDDPARVTRWQSARGLLPPYPVHKGPPEVVVDVADAPPITYNIPVPTTPVFPGDQVTCFSPDPVRELFRRTLGHLQHNGNNAPIMLAVARARLGTPDAYEFTRAELEQRRCPNGTLSFNRLEPAHPLNLLGHYTEMFGAALPITELLLQSASDRIRVFPAWPGSRRAGFKKLRAQGGFVVSAEQVDGKVKSLRIDSTAGEPLTLVSPWKQAQVRRAQDAAWEPAVVDARGLIRLQTEPGQTLTFRPE